MTKIIKKLRSITQVSNLMAPKRMHVPLAETYDVKMLLQLRLCIFQNNKARHDHTIKELK
jgi:hypothetical protein